jgi:hypothetical protein
MVSSTLENLLAMHSKVSGNNQAFKKTFEDNKELIRY